MTKNEPWIKHPVSLSGQIVELLPMEEKHFDDLLAAASDKRIWEFYPGDWSVPETFLKYYNSVLKLRERGERYPFTIVHKAKNKVIGSTMFLDIESYDKRLEIGGTWLMPEYWATAINFDCKLALLTFSFEVLRAHRVQLKTQHNNKRSWKAIEKIGGIYEGIIREHMLRDDSPFRSSAYYSILESEWPSVKKNLQENLEKALMKSAVQ